MANNATIYSDEDIAAGDAFRKEMGFPPQQRPKDTSQNQPGSLPETNPEGKPLKWDQFHPYLKDIADKYEANTGIKPTYTSGFRTQDEQDALKVPGKAKVSYHSSGRAMDQGIAGLSQEQIQKSLDYYNSQPGTTSAVHNGNHIHTEYHGPDVAPETVPIKYSDADLQSADDFRKEMGFPPQQQLSGKPQAQKPQEKGLLDKFQDWRQGNLDDLKKSIPKQTTPASDVMNSDVGTMEAIKRTLGFTPTPTSSEIAYQQATQKKLDQVLSDPTKANDPNVQFLKNTLQLKENLDTPIVSAKKLPVYPTSTIGKIGKGMVESAANLGSSLLTPSNIAMLPGGNIENLGKAFVPGMAIGTAQNAGETYKQIFPEQGPRDPEKIASALTSAALSGLMTKGLAHGMLGEEGAAPKPVEAQPSAAQEINTQPTVPESPQTIQAQLEALKANRSKAVLITPGEEMPDVPQRFKTLNTDVGNFIYDPMRISSKAIQDKVALGDHGDLLGFVEPKSENTTQTVTAKLPDGTEAKTAVVSPENVNLQVEELMKQFPDAQIETGGEEKAQEILEKRAQDNNEIEDPISDSEDQINKILTSKLSQITDLLGPTSEELKSQSAQKVSSINEHFDKQHKQNFENKVKAITESLGKDPQNAITQGGELQDNLEQHQGTTSGQNLPENVVQIRPQEGQQAGSSYRPLRVAEGQEEGQPIQYKPLRLIKSEPIEPFKELKTSGVAKSIEAKAIEGKLTEGFKGLATYEGKTVADQAARVSDFITKNPEIAEKVVSGEAELPEGLSGSMFIKGMEEAAKGDPVKLEQLASSHLITEGSIHAQELRLLGERDPASAVQIIKDLKKQLRDKAEQKLGKGNVDVAEEVESQKIKKIKSDTIKRVLKKPKTWNDFIDSIQCA